MAEKQVYECENCGNSVELGADENKVPECCGKPMRILKAMDSCQMSTTAEHSRFDDSGDPCDDGRAGS